VKTETSRPNNKKQFKRRQQGQGQSQLKSELLFSPRTSQEFAITQFVYHSQGYLYRICTAASNSPKKKFDKIGRRISYYAEFGHSMLLFCEEWQRNDKEL